MSSIADIFVDARNRKVEEAARQALSDLEVIKKWNAANIAMRYALAEQLRRVDPNNPLLIDSALRERILNHGERVLATTNNWDSVREAAQNFAIPGRPTTADSSGQVALLAALLEEIRRVNPDSPVLNGVYLRPLEEHLKTLDPDSPMLKPEDAAHESATVIFERGRAAFRDAEKHNALVQKNPNLNIASGLQLAAEKGREAVKQLQDRKKLK